MKKAALTIAVVIFGFTALFATNTFGDPLKTKKALKHKISQTVAYPEFALEEKINCSVFAIIRQESNGKITVIRCDSQVGSMREYVREKLQEMNFTGESLEIGKEYTIRVDFIYKD